MVTLSAWAGIVLLLVVLDEVARVKWSNTRSNLLKALGALPERERP